MPEHELDHLIQDVLDGVATPEQTARLEERLRRDPALEERQRELQGLFEALRRVPRVEAPTDLRNRILRALPTNAPGVRTTSTAGPARLRLAWVFVAGLAAGIVGAGALTGLWKASVPGIPQPVAGSMAPPGAPSAGPHARSASWSLEQTTVDAVAWRVGESRLARFQVRGGPAEIELRFDPAGLAPTAFRQAPLGVSPVQMEAGRVVFQASSGGEYSIEFLESGSPSPPLGVTVRAEGREAKGDLAAPAAPPGR